MASVVVTASCVVYGNGTQYTVTLPLTNPNPIAVPVQTYTLGNGNNTIATPTGVLNGVWVIPPANSTVVKAYKGIGGDTGITSTNPTSWAFIPITAGSFVISCTLSQIEVITLVWD